MTISRRTFKSPIETPQDGPGEPAGEVSATAPADEPAAAETPLSRAQIALQETAEQLKALTARRREALLTGTDEEVAAVDAEIEATQRLQRTRSDRVSVLLEHAAEEAAAARAAARGETIAAVEELLAQRDEAGAVLSAAIEASDKAFIRLIELGREIRQRWQFAQHDANPAMLTENALVQAVPHEFYRLTARPHPLGGKIVTDQLPSFPAASKAERFEDAMMPSKIRPLTEKLSQATALAVRAMKEGFSTNQLSVIPSSTPSTGVSDTPVSNVEPLPQTSPIKAQPDPELARLLARQNQLVNGPMDAAADAEYELLSAQIRARSA
jgi:hypothetical protein